MEIKDIMRVETLPKIYQQLEQMSSKIDDEVNQALSLECNEDSKQEVKKARANINKIKTDLEERRKDIKEQILKPYMQFENVYNELIKNKLIYADKTLKDRITEIELTQKQEKENNIKDYFNEYLENIHLAGLIQFDQLNIKIGLSDSEKKLREQVKCKLDNIINDIKLISLEELKNDIMLEYKNNGFDFANAKLTVINRINEKQKLEQQENKRQELEQKDQLIEQKVDDEIVVPVETVDKPVENILSTRFEVKGTREQLINLKKYMTDNEILFWSI